MRRIINLHKKTRQTRHVYWKTGQTSLCCQKESMQATSLIECRDLGCPLHTTSMYPLVGVSRGGRWWQHSVDWQDLCKRQVLTGQVLGDGHGSR